MSALPNCLSHWDTSETTRGSVQHYSGIGLGFQ